VGGGADTDGHEVEIGVLFEGHREPVDDQADAEILLVLCHPAELQLVPGVLGRETQSFEEVVLDFLARVALLDAFELKIPADECVGVEGLPLVLLLEELGLVLVDLEQHGVVHLL
jgi:hypothetical protein